MKSLSRASPLNQAGQMFSLISYGPQLEEIYRRIPMHVDKILKGGAKPDVPTELPTKFEFLINLKTAKQIGLTIPPNVLARTPDEPPATVSNLRRNLEALFCPRLKVRVRKFSELTPLKLLAVSERCGLVS